MKVGELLELLKDLNKDDEIVVHGEDSDGEDFTVNITDVGWGDGHFVIWTE